MKSAFFIFLALQIWVLPAFGESATAQLRPKIVALGDSLTAGYGLPPGAGFVPKLQAALDAKGFNVEIMDAGVAGDTTRQGLMRLDWAVGDNASGVLLELGANDALRGLDPESTEQALDEILKRLTDRNIPVLLLGMLAPPNLGANYQARYDAIFPRLAEKYQVTLYPFFLDGVAANPALNQDDGMHPNEDGVAEIVRRLLPHVENWLNDEVLQNNPG